MLSATFALADTTPPRACPGSLATPINLNPLGDNFLAVHPTPAIGVEIDELFTGDIVCALGRSGVWVRVQYVRDGRGITGWAHSRYLAPTASAPTFPSAAPNSPSLAPSTPEGSSNTNVNQQQIQQKQIIINVNPNIGQ